MTVYYGRLARAPLPGRIRLPAAPPPISRISTVSPQSRCFVRSAVMLTGMAATVGSGGWVCGGWGFGTGREGSGGAGGAGGGGGGATATVVAGGVVRTGGGASRTTGRGGGAGGLVVGGGGGGGGGFGFGATVVGGGGGGGGGGVVVGGGGCGTGSGRQCGIRTLTDNSGGRWMPMSIPMLTPRSNRCPVTARTGQVTADAGAAVSTGRAATSPIAATAPVAALAVRRITRAVPVRCGRPPVPPPNHPRTGSATGRWRRPTAPTCRPAPR
jgi:hypothetical protein